MNQQLITQQSIVNELAIMNETLAKMQLQLTHEFINYRNRKLFLKNLSINERTGIIKKFVDDYSLGNITGLKYDLNELHYLFKKYLKSKNKKIKIRFLNKYIKNNPEHSIHKILNCGNFFIKDIVDQDITELAAQNEVKFIDINTGFKYSP